MATKAVRGQKLANELVSLADKLEGRFRKAFLRSMLSIAEDPELQKLIRDIEAGRFTFGDAIDARLSAVRIDLAEMNEIARQAIAGSAKVTNQVMGLKGSFDVINDSVVNAAKNLSVDLSTYLRKSTQETLRQIIEDLIGSNISRSEAVRRITLEVGLLPQHAKAVSNYRRTLIAAGESRSRANQLAEAYAKRLLKYRANMISRTEVARATGIGQTEFWRQMRDQGSLPPQVNRVWITSLDERACDFCRSMNGQVASIDGGWETINGYKEYPQASHPHCRCSSGITTNRMTKTGKMGVIAKVEEIEYEYWLSKHLSGQHNQASHSGGNNARIPFRTEGLYPYSTKNPSTQLNRVINSHQEELGKVTSELSNNAYRRGFIFGGNGPDAYRKIITNTAEKVSEKDSPSDYYRRHKSGLEAVTQNNSSMKQTISRMLTELEMSKPIELGTKTFSDIMDIRTTILGGTRPRLSSRPKQKGSREVTARVPRFSPTRNKGKKSSSGKRIIDRPEPLKKASKKATKRTDSTQNPSKKKSRGFETNMGRPMPKDARGNPIIGKSIEVEKIEYNIWIDKHLGGKHDQKTHAGRRGAVDSAMASGGSAKVTTPKAPKKTARQKIVDSLTLGVDYDSEGYPLDNADGIVAQKLMDIVGLYDEPSDAAMAIAGRGPKKLILPLDKDGLPQILPLKQAEKRYGKTPEEVVAKVKKDFGVDIDVLDKNRNIDDTMDNLHGIAQAIEEMSMNGIPVSKMVDTFTLQMTSRKTGVLGEFGYAGQIINIYGGNVALAGAGASTPSKIITRRFNADSSFVSVGSAYGESTTRSAYGTTIHEVGHAMDLYVGTQIQQTRKKIINEVFEGTGLIRSDWAETPRGREILYTNRESNATAFYNDLGAQGLVSLDRAGLINPNQSPAYGNIGDKISFSQYATYNLRENFAETYTAYWLYGGSKGKYKKYYNDYKERVGNIVDMSQGVIKVVNPADSGVIVTDITQLPPSHPLIVWITGIVPS